MIKKECYNSEFSREIRIIDIILIGVIVILSVISIVGYNTYQDQISDQVLNYGKIGLFFSTAFLEFVPQFITPFFIPMVGVSSGISLWNVLFFVILGSIFGSILGFEFGKYYGWRIVCSLFKKETAEKVSTFWNKYGKIFVFFSAVTPLPHVPMIFGALSMSRKDFWIFGIVPRIIGFLLVATGTYYGVFYFF